MNRQLPDLLRFVWLSRSDLPPELDPASCEGRRAFLLWWLQHGRFDFSEISDLVPPEAFDELFLPDGQNPPPLARTLYQERKDVSESLRKNDTERLTAWFFIYGIAEHGYTRWLSANVKDWLCQSIEGTGKIRLQIMLDALYPGAGGNDPAGALEWFLFDALRDFDLSSLLSEGFLSRLSPQLPEAICRRRPNIKIVREKRDRAWFRDWYLAVGIPDFALQHLLSASEIDEIWTPEPDLDAALPVPKLLFSLWVNRPDLQDQFPLHTNMGRLGLVAWYIMKGQAEYQYPISPAYRELANETIPESVPSDALPVTRLFHLFWFLRGDLQAMALDTPEGRWQLASWFAIFCAKEIGCQELVGQEFRRKLLSPVNGIPQDSVLPVTHLMLAAREQRQDVYAATTPTSQEGREKLVAWFYTSAITEMSLSHWLDEDTRDRLCCPMPGTIQDAPLPLSVMMGLIRLQRPDVAELTPIDSREGRRRLVAWSVLYGFAEYGLSTLVTHRQRLQLQSPSPLGDGVTNFMELVHCCREDVHTAFDLSTREGRLGLVEWWKANATTEIPLLSGSYAGHGEPQLLRQVTIRRSTSRGVNLIGYARNELGIGEDLRCMALALESAGIPFTIINLPPRNNSRAADQSVARLISNERIYDTNIFCLTGFDTVWAYAKLGPQFFEGVTNIGNWPWELPTWPREWSFALDFVDELWGISKYCRDCYLQATDKPVRWMPSAVRPLETPTLGRAELGLPEGCFVFTVIYDSNSFEQRKNPRAAWDAFEQAFGRNSDGPMLVIKTMNADENSDSWRTLRSRAEASPSVRLINETWSYDRTIALVGASDCFVSLHRAEGLGRGIAEAMTLGIPVLATGWSGSVDLLADDRGLAVDFHMVPVPKGAYPYAEGQTWAEPSIAHAAARMRDAVRMNGRALRELAERGRAHVLSQHSIEAAGRRYRERLEQIWG